MGRLMPTAVSLPAWERRRCSGFAARGLAAASLKARERIGPDAEPPHFRGAGRVVESSRSGAGDLGAGRSRAGEELSSSVCSQLSRLPLQILKKQPVVPPAAPGAARGAGPAAGGEATPPILTCWKRSRRARTLRRAVWPAGRAARAGGWPNPPKSQPCPRKQPLPPQKLQALKDNTVPTPS